MAAVICPHCIGLLMIDIWWYGQACFRIKGRNTTIVVDPYDANFTGLSPLKVEGDVVCITHDHEDHNNAQAVKGTSDAKSPFVTSGPGEYEISGVNIVGVSSFHDNKEGEERGKNTVYKITIDDVDFVHLGDLGQKKLTQVQIETLSSCDVLFIPVGGVYTISAGDVPDIISAIEPKIIVPMHYKVAKLKFDLDPVSKFLEVMGKEKLEPISKLSISKEKLPQEVEIAVLEQQ